ncbi:hypothetical protein FNV43_RR03693 [Rhamnella rubrinervis]|uniref:J domain-containing protein n=1 Tax=Rhamnella rubrinervis TaxID=2594499 RepID=A0A8K0HKG9_9ROSA|nr:hypothetical protein FNV43_RR03693 [Rhamnella rubrinervis]
MTGTLTLAAATTPMISTPDNRFTGIGTKNTATTGSASLFKEAPSRLRLRCQAFTETRPDTRRSATGRSRGSLYEILRVNNNASPVEIKTAYRTLAKLYHPDASSSVDGCDFIKIHNAYATLSDPDSRALYDLSLSIAPNSSSSSSFGFYPTRRWETDQCW